jgi:hypothetical protein
MSIVVQGLAEQRCKQREKEKKLISDACTSDIENKPNCFQDRNVAYKITKYSVQCNLTANMIKK